MVKGDRYHRHERLGKRYGLWVGLAVLALVTAGICVWWMGQKPKSSGRLNVLIVGDPVILWSYNQKENYSTFITIPAEVQIEGVYGYGRYTLASLWQLGQIDKVKNLLSESLAEALGLPIPWYVGRAQVLTSAKIEDPLILIRQIFNPGFAWLALKQSLETNISWTTSGYLTWVANQITPSRLKVIALDSDTSLESEILPDGSTVKVLLPEKLDRLLGDNFEDDEVRREALTVAIYNTTDFPNLGQRWARTLSHLGVLVITVGNRQPEEKRCTLTLAKENKAKYTTRLIEQVLDCQPVFQPEPLRADLEIKLGTANKLRYLPMARKN